TASGIALLIIFAYVFKTLTKVEFKPSMFRSLSTLLATVIIIDLFLLVVEMLTVFWPTSSTPGHAIRMIEFFTGRLAWALLPVFILGITAFALLARRSTRHLPAIQLTASAMYVIAIFFTRYALMAMGFSLTPLGQPTDIYFPSLVEGLLALGILAFGLLLVTIAIKILPLETPEHEHEPEHEHGAGHASLDADSLGEPVLQPGVTSP
ncbi:MAG: hypothetical protein Q8K89_06900, partial [Actinomycetota bacterium]|nr:hypothetical protein [Actinomycetota bacterium]